MATRANVNRNTGGNDVKNAEAREPMGQTCSKCGARRVDSQIGLERTPEEFVAALVGVFREVRRVLREDGTLWLNLGDSYASFRDGKATPDTTRGDSTGTLVPKGEAKNRMASTFAGSAIKHKDLVGIPWRVAFALQQDGWYLRQDIIWHKPNPMPESVTDRCTKSHEYIFLFAKGQWKSRVVECADFGGKRGHFLNDSGLDDADMRANKIAVGFASAILDGAKSKNDVALLALDAKVGPQRSAHSGGDDVASLPVEHCIAILASRFLGSDCSTEEFLCKLHGFGLALSDGDKLLIGGGATVLSLPPGVNRYGNASVAVHDAGQICEFDVFHGRIIHRWPSGCQYYYDAEAIKEPAADPARELRCEGENAYRGQAAIRPRGATRRHRKPAGWDTGAGAHGAFHREGRAQEVEYTETEATNRNKRDVWTVPTAPYSGAHFATFPPNLIRPCILAGCPQGGTVLDPFGGSGTTAEVAEEEGRNSIVIELNPAYVTLAEKRTAQRGLFCQS